jgi:cation-transporting ATPase 13A3/4/5
MSVITKQCYTGQYRAFVKGSPEKIKELCRPETLPERFEEVLSQYTSKGYRVIALATKEL